MVFITVIKSKPEGRLTWHIHFSWPLRFLKRVFYVTHTLAMNPLCSPDWPQIQHIPASLYPQILGLQVHIISHSLTMSTQVMWNLTLPSFPPRPTLSEEYPPEISSLNMQNVFLFIPSNISLRKLIIPCLDCYKNPQKARGFPSEAVRCDVL